MLRSSQASSCRPSFSYLDRGPSVICVQPSHGLNWREVRKQSSNRAGGRRKETTQGRQKKKRMRIRRKPSNGGLSSCRSYVKQTGLTCTLFGGPLISQQDSNSVTSSHNSPVCFLSYSPCLSSVLFLANLTNNNPIKKSPKCFLDLVPRHPPHQSAHLGRQGGIEVKKKKKKTGMSACLVCTGWRGGI